MPRAHQKLTVTVTEETAAALESAAGITGDTRTDAVNRAIQNYAQLAAAVAQGCRVMLVTGPSRLERLDADSINARAGQLAQLGSLPDGTSGHNFRQAADEARRSRERAERNEAMTWFHLAREAFWAAASETDPDRLRGRLLEVASVSVGWAADIDRRHSGEEQR